VPGLPVDPLVALSGGKNKNEQMEMFLLNHEVARLDGTCNQSHPWTAITLAWHLRERNAARAEILAARWEIPPTASRKALDPRIAARARLIRAEAKMLGVDYAAACDLAASARTLFDEMGDGRGGFDAYWLLAQAAHERCFYEEGIALLEEGGKRARAAGDALRIEMAHAAQCFLEVLAGWRTTYRRSRTPGVAANVLAPQAWEQAAKGMIAFEKCDFAKAIEFAATAHDAAARTGQLRQAISCAVLVGRAFTELEDHRGAVEWMSEGLALARVCAGPERVFPSLMHVLAAMQRLATPDDVRRLTDEALRMEDRAGDVDGRLLLRHILGDQALKRRDHGEALEYFAQLESRSDLLGRARWRIESRCGRAVALAHLQRPVDAMTAARAALTLARENEDGRRQVAAMKLIAELHGQHGLPDSGGLDAAGACLHYLLLARDLARSIADFPSMFQLLGAIAREYAKAGNHAHAYGAALLQIRVGKKCQAETVDRRSAALRARHRIDLLHLPREHGGAPDGARGEVQGELFSIRMDDDASAGVDAEFVRFVAGASHQLRQPLHAVSLYLEALNSFALPESTQGALAGMHQCFRALENIFLSLLDLACLQAEAMRPVRESFPIMEVLSELADECAREARRKTRKLRVVPCSCWVQSDKPLLRKMLHALATTALQHPGTTRVTIGCRRKGERLRVAIYAASEAATGDGADPRAGAFDGLSASDQTLTLHLALARRLGALLQSPVSLDWLPHGGSVAALELPLAPVEAALTARRISQPSGATLGDKLIVVIEDDVLVRGAMHAALERRGCVVVVAASCREAIEALSGGLSAPDALVCDFRLEGGVTGLQAIRTLRSEFNTDVPALVITAEPFASELEEVARENISILPKPVQFSQLWETLARIVLS